MTLEECVAMVDAINRKNNQGVRASVDDGSGHRRYICVDLHVDLNCNGAVVTTELLEPTPWASVFLMIRAMRQAFFAGVDVGLKNSEENAVANFRRMFRDNANGY